MSKGQHDQRLRRDIIGIGLAALGAVVLVSLISGPQATGFLPRNVSQGLLLSFGVGAYLTPVILLVLGVLHMLERRDLGDMYTAMGLVLLFLIVMILFQLSIPLEDFFARDDVLSGGGYVGAALGWLLLKIVGLWGSYIVLLALGVIAILLVTRVSVQGLAGRTVSMIAEGGVRARRTASRNLLGREAGLRARAEKTVRRNGSARRSPRVQLEDDEASSNTDSERGEYSSRRPSEGSNPQSAANSKTGMPSASPEHSGRPQLQLVSEPTGFTPPPLTLLSKEGMDLQTSEMRAETAERIIKLEDTLQSFGIQATVRDYECGPVLTRYEVEPEKGIRVNKITRLADDLAMSLAAVDVRVEAPIPGRSAIGIEVPNEHRSVVSLRGLMELDLFKNHKGTLPIALGRDIAGGPVVTDLMPMPHLLVAGATGAGKSICLHTVILSLIMTHPPHDLKVILIDPKRVELTIYDGIPHLMSPVVYSVREAADVLHKAIMEMEKRYDKFALRGVSNLSEYNELARMPKEHAADEFRPFPRVVIIIDELADLMMQARAEFEYSICRIAQLARATGIHLVIATQRPAANIITGNIKANMPSRIALAVASNVDSRVILDTQGAERLIGSGDMLFAPIDAPKPRRIQGAFVRREDIARVVEHLCRQGEPEFEIEPTVLSDGEDYAAEMEASDELLEAAAEYIISEDQASVSMLQRRFKIGYARAGRLIDMLERAGICGPHQGSKPREVIGTMAVLREHQATRDGQGTSDNHAQV